jgi:hypothetical protein
MQEAFKSARIRREDVFVTTTLSNAASAVGLCLRSGSLHPAVSLVVGHDDPQQLKCASGLVPSADRRHDLVFAIVASRWAFASLFSLDVGELDRLGQRASAAQIGKPSLYRYPASPRYGRYGSR